MAITNWHNLTSTISNWLGQPDDPLLTPAIPDCITLFEVEANRRLHSRWAEKTVTLTPTPGDPLVPLPADYGALRNLRRGQLNMGYLTPEQMQAATGSYYTVEGGALRLAFVPGDSDTLTLLYMTGIPALGPTMMTNWLLDAAPDLYLFGSLAEAEAFLQNDERVPGWIQRREAGFASLREADRRALWPGKLRIRADVTFPLGTRNTGYPVW